MPACTLRALKSLIPWVVQEYLGSHLQGQDSGLAGESGPVWNKVVSSLSPLQLSVWLIAAGALQAATSDHSRHCLRHSLLGPALPLVCVNAPINTRVDWCGDTWEAPATEVINYLLIRQKSRQLTPSVGREITLQGSLSCSGYVGDDLVTCNHRHLGYKNWAKQQFEEVLLTQLQMSLRALLQWRLPSSFGQHQTIFSEPFNSPYKHYPRAKTPVINGGFQQTLSMGICARQLTSRIGSGFYMSVKIFMKCLP